MADQNMTAPADRLSCEAAFLLALAEHGVASAVGEILIQGDGRHCGPGALAKAIAAYDRARYSLAATDLVEAVAKAIRAEINRYWRDDTVEADDRTLGQAAITAYEAHRRAAAITPQPDPRDAEIERWKEAIDRVNDRCITLINEKDAKDAEIERLREVLELVSDARMRRPDGTIADAGWNITKLNEARVRIDAAFAKSGGLVMADVMHAHIDYGYGKADLFGTFTEETVKRHFYRAANQCFGIRKSISDFKLLSIAPASLPSPWDKLEGAATVLMHSGDTIVFSADGEKIKSEWD